MPLVPRALGYRSTLFPEPTLPCDWIVDGGRPAAILGSDGWPSFEDEEGRFLVYDFLLVDLRLFGSKALPRWYGVASILAPGGPVPLYHQERAQWKWRPLVWNRYGWGWGRLGSQAELAWRHALGIIQHVIHGGADEDEVAALDRANERARNLLRSCLTPLQRIEYAHNGRFRCRGAKTGNIYEIEEANGFAILDHVTMETTVSYCMHPEDWMPHADVALATKLALEDPDLEVECLENARMTVVGRSHAPTEWDKRAYELEKEMIR